MANNTGIEREMSWDDTFENDSTYTIVPAGDYDFTVTGFERGRHNGSEKLPACNKAVLTLEITDGINTTTVTHNLFLHSRTEGMVCEFFVAIGHRKHGEALKPNWNAIVGATGRCKVSTRTYNGNEYNDIKKFYEGYTVEGLTDTDKPLDKLKKAELEAKAQEMGIDITGLKTREEILAAIMAKVAEGGGA